MYNYANVKAWGECGVRWRNEARKDRMTIIIITDDSSGNNSISNNNNDNNNRN